MPTPDANKPSEAAVRVARDYYSGALTTREAQQILAAAHDPNRFKDPCESSVNLGAVLDALRERPKQTNPPMPMAGPYNSAADFLLRRFGGDRG